MKKLCLFIFVILLVLSFTTGCQYLIPPIIQAGSVSIDKNIERTTPEQTVPPDVYEVEVIPPGQTVPPSSFGETSWYLPNSGKREK